MMPVMDGFEFRAEQLKSGLLADIPTILLSADAAVRKQPEAFGIPFFKKLFELTELFTAIEKNFSFESGS